MSSRILPFKHSAAPKPTQKPRTRVLIVDDDERMRLYVDAVLRGEGYETTLAADGDDAIAVAARAPAPFDLLVTDEMMPRMRGHQLARYMRELYLNIKVLYLSGFREQLFSEKGSLWADETFLDKPCTPEALLQAVSLVLFGPQGKAKPENDRS
jgi:two-component system, cell cycle sensor histidine kinase and response regulator CckA